MPSLPSLHSLRAFEAAARFGSFARAAAELNLTPSAVSHQIRGLEQHFGRALFHRATRQVILTPEGERLQMSLSQAFTLIRTACADLSPAPQKSDLSLHCTPSFATKWLSPRLPGFMVQEPGINIRITTSAERIDLRHRQEVDVMIAYGAAPTAPGITVRSFGEEEIAALCTPDYNAAHGAQDSTDLASLTLLESTFSPVRWPDWFAANNLPTTALRLGPAFDRGSLVVAAAAQGMGIALETLRFAQTELDSGSLVRFGGDRYRSLRRDMHYLSYRSATENDRNIRHFRDWVLGAA